MEVGVCVGLISVCCVSGAGLAGVLDQIPGAIEKQLRPSAVRHESPSASEPLEEDGLDNLWIEIEELQLVSCLLGGNKTGHAMDGLGHFSKCAHDQASNVP